MPIRITLSLLVLFVLSTSILAGNKFEGPLKPFVGKARFAKSTVFKGERFPNILVTTKGTLVATYGNKRFRVRRSEDGGKTWGKEMVIAQPGFQGGGGIVDENTGDLFVFVEEKHPPAKLTIFRSSDDGKTWKSVPVNIAKDSRGNELSMHMNDAGITLRHGKHAGRIIRPARDYAGKNESARWPKHYTSAIYSDDHGKTWKPSEPFPEMGTGEACIAELSDGTLYYNSRVHWPEVKTPTRRREAWSTDGGHTWKDWKIIGVLPDGRQDRAYGCMGGLTRLPVDGRDILVFSNLDTSNKTRERITVWGSFDGGKSWPIKRLVDAGPSAYSSMNSGRPGTPSEGWIYLHYEAKGQSTLARFNLTWLLAGESTGNGKVPNWVKK
ncbi:MAG: glycosyl hydrolase [Verrucomicrobiales bacterium]|nr:glycosyl hydrolase [Verrucomicrobiales bacterium]|tara:strand:- start:6826 stop:7971 length:1146 start_codon:yes stop_codon:yes gene_type:complete